MNRKWIFLFCWLFSPIVAFSGTATTTFTVSATISAACNVTASNLSFGTYNPILAANLDATTSMGVTCTNGSPYTVGLDAGSGSGATVANRLMTRTSGGTNTIAYSLYQDSAHTTVWGFTPGTNTVAGTGTGVSQPLTIYGRIFSSNLTTIPPASYSDTVTVTVNF